MINKIYKRIHSRYLNIFKFFFFLRYVLVIFLIASLLFLFIPKFFDYEKKQQVIKKYLSDNYGLEMISYNNVKFKILPLPNLSFNNVNLSIQNKSINIKSNNINIFLKFKNIYDYKNFEARKILLNKNEITLNTSKTKDLLNYVKELKHKLNITALNLNLKKEGEALIKIKNINFSNYGYKKYQIKGYLFDKEFRAKFTNGTQNLKFKLLNTGIKANFKFNEENLTHAVTGSSKINLLNNILKFDFYFDGDKIKISKSNFRNKKLSFSLDSLINFKPYFLIDTRININEVDKNLTDSLDLDEILKNKKIIKKLNGKININYKNKRFFSYLINNHSSNLDLAHGKLVYSNKTFIEGGEIVCKGESELVSEYPRLTFMCSIDLKDKKKLFKNLSISKKIKKEPINLFIEGSLNLLNRKVNFTNIVIKKDKVNEEDIKYFKEVFEEILFDEGFFKLFNKNKIKGFIIEIS